MKAQDIDSIREFNRFYTNLVGLIDQKILHTSFSLPEIRVLFELYHNGPCTASVILDHLRIDKGYLSRLLAKFSRKGLLLKRKNNTDRRAVQLTLTQKGKSQFRKANQAAIDNIGKVMGHLSRRETEALVMHMDRIQSILRH